MSDNLNIFGTTYSNVTGIKATDTNNVVQTFIHPQATQGATTYTPTTSNQTISSGTYLTGTQTISGDSNLVAGNIKSGTTIFGVTGSYTGGGSSKNGQIWSGFGKVQNAGYIVVPNMTITVSKTGTYDVYWCGYRSSTSGTWGSRLYINGTGYGSSYITTFDEVSPSIQIVHLSGVSLDADDVLTVKARSRGSSYTFYIFDLVIIEQ